MMKKFYLMALVCTFFFSAHAQQIATFDDFELPPGSWYNGADGTGGFSSGSIWFPNEYNSEWQFWRGFSVSNMKDSLTAGWENQYSAITAGGVQGSENYAVVYADIPVFIEFEDSAELEGLYITNSTFTYLSLRDGDTFSKKFGGPEGDDPDYLKVIISGTDMYGNKTDSVEFFLSDFRNENKKDDYIVRTWEWVDLSDLGIISSLHFKLESSDASEYGMNTPAYFCIDDLKSRDIATASGSTFIKAEDNLSGLLVFPNPVKNSFVAELPAGSEKISLAGPAGERLIVKQLNGERRLKINLSGYPSGVYFIGVKTETGRLTRKIVKY